VIQEPISPAIGWALLVFAATVYHLSPLWFRDVLSVIVVGIYFLNLYMAHRAHQKRDDQDLIERMKQ
jgi:hypothetical protein